MLSREEFKEKIEFLMNKSTENREFYDMFKSNFLINITGEYIDEIVKLIERVMEDDSGWLSWWMFECNYGKDNPFVWIDNAKYEIRTIDGLYDLITGII